MSPIQKLDCIALLLAALFAALYLNERRYPLRDLRCIAVVLVAGCALGRSLAYFWPGDHSLLIPWLRVGVDAGLAMVLAAMAWGRVQAFFGEPPMQTFQREVLQLLARAKSKAEFNQAKVAAAAALRQDGVDRRALSRKKEDSSNEGILS